MNQVVPWSIQCNAVILNGVKDLQLPLLLHFFLSFPKGICC